MTGTDNYQTPHILVLGGINMGLALLNKLTSGDVNLVLDRNKQYSIFDDSIQAVTHEFSGPHPSGNIGIHIHHIDPISDRNDIVWYISLQDLNDLGNFFKDGVYPTEKYISVAGSCVSDPAFYKIKKGMLISDILKDQIVDDESMLISGDVLSGIISSLVGKNKLNPFLASCAGVWIHGNIAKKFGPGLIAEDIVKNIPNTLRKLKKTN